MRSYTVLRTNILLLYVFGSNTISYRHLLYTAASGIMVLTSAGLVVHISLLTSSCEGYRLDMF